MGFKRVKYQNFRNIKSQEIKVSGGLNLLTGLNGSGKTNILEGLSILSGWGPLEGKTKISELAKRESEQKTILLTGQKNEEYGDIIQVKIDSRFAIRYNDKTITASELRSKMPVLSFLPNDTQLIEGPASRRRRLTDLVLALIVPSYAKRHSDYARAVKQKTVLLKRGECTEITDKVITPLAAWIWKMRKEVTEILFEEMKKTKELVPEGIELQMTRGGGNFTEDEKEDFIYAAEKAKEKEKQYKIPLVGPHRDDIKIKCKGIPAAEALSRGFRRRTAIALMLAAGSCVFRKTGNIPTLLLDEITAELDAEGREILFGTLLDRKAQVFAATAEPFTEHFSGNIYKVEEGQVEQITG